MGVDGEKIGGNTMVTLSEKAALAQEVGLNYQADLIKEKEMLANDVALKFKKTTHQEVCDFLIKPYEKRNLKYGSYVVISLLIGTIFVPCCVAWHNLCYFLGVIIFIPLSAILSFIADVRRVTIQNMEISEWEHELPTGALLAMKEAKAVGIDDFTIYYPTVAKREDPAITGKKNGRLYLVFLWDDSKVYE